MNKIEHLSDSVTLYLGDCRDVLPTLARADVTITDPPYAEKTHAGARTGGGEETLIDFASISEDDLSGPRGLSRSRHQNSNSTLQVVSHGDTRCGVIFRLCVATG